jgi:hypothetical protein
MNASRLYSQSRFALENSGADCPAFAAGLRARGEFFRPSLSAILLAFVSFGLVSSAVA